MKRLNASKTIGALQAARKPASEIGTRPSATGLQTITANLPESSAPAGAAEAARALAAWAASSHRLKITFETLITYPPTGGFETAISEVRVSGETEAIAVAVEELALSMAPARPNELASALRNLAAVTVDRPRDDSVHAACLLAEKLSQYPGDVVLPLLERWGDHNKWFPVWPELRVQLEKLVAPRRAILDALRQKPLTSPDY